MVKIIESEKDAFQYVYQEMLKIKDAKIEKVAQIMKRRRELDIQIETLHAESEWLKKEENELDAEIKRYEDILLSVEEFDLPF